MRDSGMMLLRTAAAAAVLSALLTACGGGDSGGGKAHGTDRHQARHASPASDPRRIPDVGNRLQARIPRDSRQVVAVYGKSRNSAESTVALYTKHGSTWQQARSWPAHNGKRGWTTHHHQGDNRSPVGVYSLSDAGGVLPNPGSRLPYTTSGAFAAPHYWARSHWHDFDYVIAINYNRVKGRSPLDATRPEGQEKGGSIWLHMDHGSGTSACVSLSKSGMVYLLRHLDPAQHPVVVMGDRAHLRA